MAANKKRRKPSEGMEEPVRDPQLDWEPDWTTFEARSYRKPSPYEIASLSISLAKGKDPKNHLQDAYNLYWDSYDLLRKTWESDVEINRKFLSNWHNNPDKDSVLFQPAEDWDEARQYLADHGYRLQTPRAVFKNLEPVWKDLRQPDFIPGDAGRSFSLLRKKQSIRLGRRYLAEMVKRHKAKKSEGGKKSHKTRKRNSVKPRGKK